jgi:hypothetical protein
MRHLIILATVLLAAQSGADKPWEQRVDLPVPVPIELPAIPATNPFASAVVSPPAPTLTPLREKFSELFTVEAAVYIDAEGTCQRVVFTRLPWPGLGPELKTALLETRFNPARAGGTAVPAWIPLAVDLRGRINRGGVDRLQGVSPDPAHPPVAETVALPSPDAADLALPATAVTALDQLPSPKHFRARIEDRSWRQQIKLLDDIDEDGHCRRVVFLSCPEGLRAWLLASMASWSFRPAQGATGAVRSWVEVDGAIDVEVGRLASDAIRVTRQAVYPRAAAATGGAPPPGA